MAYSFNPFTSNFDLVGLAGSVAVGAFSSTPSTNGLTISAGVLSLTKADATHPGGLSSSDWSTFNTTTNTVNAAASINTASTLVLRDVSGNFSASTITASLTGAASLNVLTSAVNAANGVCPLDSSSKVPLANLPSVVMEYQGAWNPNTNTPSLADGVGTNGNVYYVSAAKSTAVSGLNDPSMVNFQIGDLVVYSTAASAWQLVTPAAGVQSVNGAQGAVTVNAINQLTGDATAGPASGSASAAITLATVATPGTSTKVTYNAKGLVTSGTTLSSGDIPNNAANTTGSAASFTGSLVGDVTGTQGATSVVKVNGASVPTSATLLGSNGSGQLISNTTAYAVTATGDIGLTTFTPSNNISSATNVTGLAFANATVRSAQVLYSVIINATTSLYETGQLLLIQKGAAWEMSQTTTGDISGMVFTVTTAGQVQYTNNNYTGFSSAKMQFRALVTNV